MGAEIQLWKSRFETEGMGRVEELESARNKLQAKIVESEELVDVLATKVANAEKSKTRMNSELDDLAMEYERVHAAALITEKRGKNFDKVLGEWQSKAADVSAEVAASQDEGRNYTSELFRLKAAHDEALEQEENKVLRAQLELGQVKQEIDRRVAEKEEEFNNTRKNHARAMESMSASLEAEQKAKGEALRVKKALEGEINELEIGLDHANKANSEGLKSVKRYQGQLKETIQLYEDEARSRSQIMEQVGISERKAAALSGELEESKALLDSAERAKRQLEMEIGDGRSAVNNMQVINGRDMTAKRGLEGAIHTIQAEVDAMLGAAKNAEEKSKKAMVDAARLADELRAEQDHASAQASAKGSLNNQFGQLEAELAATQARSGESAKAYQRAERKCKELAFS